MFQQLLLQLGKAVRVFEMAAPFDVGFSPQGAETAAGCVQEHPVKTSQRFRLQLQGIARQGPDDAEALSAGVLLQFLKLPGRLIDGDDLPFIFHEAPNMGGFAPKPGADIQNALSRMGVEDHGDELRGFILNMDPALLIDG